MDAGGEGSRGIPPGGNGRRPSSFFRRKEREREREVLKVAGGSETAIARFPRALLRSDGKLWKKFSLTGYTREAVCLPFSTFERESR